MLLYPHWLDGEFVRIRSRATGPKQDVRDLIRALKLHALLGTRFLLSDVQVFDSAAILALFADPQARKFLREEADFLGLKVRPDRCLPSHSYGLAVRGLARTRSEGWISSVFVADPMPIKELADEIINEVQSHSYLDLNRPSQTMFSHPEFRDQLMAVRHAVGYFGSCYSAHPDKLIAPAGVEANYYQVLHEMVSDTDGKVPEKQRGRAQEAIDFIDKQITDLGARKARSKVFAVLHRMDDPTKRARIWNNVVQAWNYATQRTVGPAGGAVGGLPGAAPVAPCFDLVTDTLVRVDVSPSPMLAVSDPAELPCELDEISWSQITQVLTDTRCVETIRTLTSARCSGNIDWISETLRGHLRAVARHIHPSKNTSGVTYAILIGGVAIGVVGAMCCDMLPVKLAAAAKGYLEGVKLLHQFWDDGTPWWRRHSLANTLFDTAMGQQK